MKIELGQKAPDFTLFDTEKNPVTLSSFRGENVLLLFFPLAFTSVCTKELCSVRDSIGFYEKVRAKVFGISVDSLYSLARFKAEQKLNFPLLSDFNKKTSLEYGSLYDTFSFSMQGVSKRSAFIIDKEGVVRYAEVLENAGEVPDFKKIREVLERLD